MQHVQPIIIFIINDGQQSKDDGKYITCTSYVCI
jgi:hypothetical protein